MARNKNDRLTLTSVTSFEVKAVGGDWTDTTNRWHEVSRQCQGVANLFWEAWVAWHYSHDSYRKMKDWLEKRANGSKAKCPVDTMPKELAREIYRRATERYPGLSANLVSLVLQRVQKTMTARKAAKGSLPGATAILLNQESHPSYTRPFPILFDRANTMTAFEDPAERGGNWHLRMRFWRTQIDGKSVRVEDRMELWCKGKKVQSQVRILERIASAEYKFCGSQLIYSRGKRKWFAKLCYEMPRPEKLPLDAGKVAVLSAGADCPLVLEMPDGDTKRPMGAGHHVIPVRRKLLKQRWNRRANYRNAGSASKGHGRERAGAGPQWKLQQRWKDFVKHNNRIAARAVIDWCVAAGVGAVEYWQPDGEFGATRFLHNAGKVDGRNDSTGWDWFQLRTFLEQAAAKVGIEVRVEKQSCEGSGDEKTTGTSRNNESNGTARTYAKTAKNGKPLKSGNGQAGKDRSKSKPQGVRR